MATSLGGTGNSVSGKERMRDLATLREVSSQVFMYTPADESLDALPSRIFVNAIGVEAFFYNRTPAYDDIVERMKKYDAAATASDADTSKAHSGMSGSSTGREKVNLRERSSIRRDKSKVSSGGVSDGGCDGLLERHYADSVDAKDSPDDDHSIRSTPDSNDVAFVDWAREIMPMDFSVQQGSLILGNDATPSVLIAHFERSTGGVNYTDVSPSARAKS